MKIITPTNVTVLTTPEELREIADELERLWNGPSGEDPNTPVVVPRLNDDGTSGLLRFLLDRGSMPKKKEKS